MDREATYAFGVELRLTPSADGGRLTPLLDGSGSDRRFHYRPNWGLPGMIPPEQTGAPVLAFSREQIAPGEACRAVIVAMFPSQVPRWAEVTVGTDLPLYEGSHVRGVGHVVWRAETKFPVPDEDESRFLAWLAEP
jgi:hypothetical protein